MGLTLALMLAVIHVAPARALTNGDFEAGLNSWQTAGPVSVDAGELVLADDGPSDASAWQVTGVTATRTRLEFDVLAALSDFTPSDPFGFPDIFATSVYLFDDPTGFAPGSGTALLAISVITFDWKGPYDVGGLVEPAARGGDWLHVSMEFDSPTLYMAPAFELFELGFVGGDSQVRIDDVVMTPVPEPGTALLLGLGLAGMAITRRST